MIVANDFVYFHKGKTGGDKFYELINKHEIFRDSIIYQDYIRGKDGRNINSLKHNTLWWLKQNNYNTEFMDYVMGFRQLPSWLLSFANHHLYEPYKDTDVAIKHINKQLNKGLIIKHGDSLLIEELNIYDDWNWIYADNFWQILIQLKNKPIFIRQEYLLEDFNRKIALPYYNIKLKQDDNNLINNFDKSDSPFKISNIETIYRDNPLWTKLEKELYNDKDS
jgi:hypothetical protein